MVILALVALVAGGMAVLRQAVGIGFLLRFVRRARLDRIPKGPTPPISLLKPLYGEDPGLLDNLLATLRQNYPGFEVLFLHERPDDPALDAVDAAVRAVPDVELVTISGRDDAAVNPKVAVLLRGEAKARHDILATADSDVRPDPCYLRDIANGLRDADVVSFLPVMFGMRTVWTRAIALLVNSDALLGLLTADGRAVTGSTIGISREALARVGGFRAVADCIADDYSLGAALRAAGCRLALARRPARLFTPGGGGRETARWAVRWARTIRSAAPGVYFTALPFAFAPLLLVATALATPYAGAAWLLLGLHTLARAVTATIVDVSFCRDQSTLKALPLLPLLWLAEPAAALAGLFGNTICWRGRRYRLKGGRATLLDA